MVRNHFGRLSALGMGLLLVALGARGLTRPSAAAGSGISRSNVKPDVPVTAMDLISKTSNNSPSLSTDPTDSRVVALANRIDGPDFGCALQLSGDGGRSWVSSNPVPELPLGAEKCYAPEVGFDRRGTLYYLFVGLAGTGNRPMGVFLTTTNDAGRSFSQPWQVLGEKRYMVRMLLDRGLGETGRMHLTWLQTALDPSLGGLPVGEPNPIMAAHSDDGGKTFSAPVQVSEPSRVRVVAPTVALGDDHAVHVLYYDLKDDAVDYQGLEGPTWSGTWSLLMATSEDSGESFAPSVVVDDEVVPPERVMLIFTMPPPALAADNEGRIYAGWHDARNGDWDVFVRVSMNGRTWSAPVRINDDPLGNGRHQYLPRLAAAPGGRIDAIFYDRRGNVANRSNDVYYASSVDRGASFSRNVRLTNMDSDSEIGPRYAVPSAEGLFEFGSRLALESGDDRVKAAWTDTRNTGRGAPAQDIFATEVDIEVGSMGLWYRLAIAGLILLSLAIAVLGWRHRSRRSAPVQGAA